MKERLAYLPVAGFGWDCEDAVRTFQDVGGGPLISPLGWYPEFAKQITPLGLSMLLTRITAASFVDGLFILGYLLTVAFWVVCEGADLTFHDAGGGPLISPLGW